MKEFVIITVVSLALFGIMVLEERRLETKLGEDYVSMLDKLHFHQAVRKPIPCDTDTDCMEKNGGDGR